MTPKTQSVCTCVHCEKSVYFEGNYWLLQSPATGQKYEMCAKNPNGRHEVETVSEPASTEEPPKRTTPVPESYMICGRTLTEIRTLIQQDEIRKSGIPDEVLEFHIRIKKGELKSLISEGLAEDCKPGEVYAKVVEDLFENSEIKSALVMRVYGNQED